MKKYSAIILTIIVLSGITGCSDYLDVKPESSITSSSFWNSEGDCKTYLVGIYDVTINLFNTTLYGEDRGDSFDPGDIGPVTNAWAQSLSASNAPSWSEFYTCIYHINRLLSEVKGISFNNQGDKDRVMAEAYALRALIYFHMAKIWGGVPLVITPTEDANVELLPRSSVNDVFVQINSDITTALALFPENGFVNKNRISKPATYALRADVKMWTGKVLGGGDTDYTAALNAISQVEASGVLLLDEFKTVFSSSNKKNDEIIFSFYFGYPERFDLYPALSLSPWSVTISSATNYDEIPTRIKSGDGGNAWHIYGPSAEIKQAFAEHASDVRKNASMIDVIIVNGMDTTILLTSQNKFRGTIYDDRYYDDDLIIYRFGDIVLLKAEALAALNRLTEAVTEMNKIKHRAGISDYSGTLEKVAVETEILNERWKELFLEQKRYPDLIRFHYGGTINIYEQVPNLMGKSGYPLYSPVEQSVLDNNNLIEQTEGY